MPSHIGIVKHAANTTNKLSDDTRPKHGFDVHFSRAANRTYVCKSGNNQAECERYLRNSPRLISYCRCTCNSNGNLVMKKQHLIDILVFFCNRKKQCLPVTKFLEIQTLTSRRVPRNSAISIRQIFLLSVMSWTPTISFIPESEKKKHVNKLTLIISGGSAAFVEDRQHEKSFVFFNYRKFQLL